ncbi:MAG: TetR/AcrR family transcriptional regulator [FCB group bacterium]|nr:TetR/AcrR family transcriptional regulator [FCB group bacterium]
MTISDRKTREKEQRRKSILTAAEKLFARDGYTATSLDRVAEEVEISKGTIYLYFKNKEDLFFTLIRERFEALIQRVSEQIAEAGTLEELVTTGIQVMLDETRKQHYLFRLTSAEQTKIKSTAHRELRAQIMAIRNSYIQALETAVEHFIPDGLNVSSRSIALVMTGAINTAMMEWMISNQTIDLEPLKKDITTIILRGITHE